MAPRLRAMHSEKKKRRRTTTRAIRHPEEQHIRRRRTFARERPRQLFRSAARRIRSRRRTCTGGRYLRRPYILGPDDHGVVQLDDPRHRAGSPKTRVARHGNGAKSRIAHDGARALASSWRRIDECHDDPNVKVDHVDCVGICGRATYRRTTLILPVLPRCDTEHTQ